MLFFLALTLASSSAPSGDLVINLDMSADYPTQARRNGWQGDVTAELSFDANGRVSACRVVKSSNYPVLDEGTCDLLKQRARFKTKDKQGAEGTVVTPL